MASELTMPQLGLTMTEGIVSRWLKAEGDTCLLYTSPSPRDA